MTIADQFSGKNIFITGASGFLGKLLIEKLLRFCKDVGNIYVLLRPKRGRPIEERLDVLKASSAFTLLLQENPDALNKLIAVAGDIAELNLGISYSDRQMLIENVDIMYHSAASVRFDDFLKEALILNLRATREIINIALESKRLSKFVYVSTTFCNSDRYIVQEKVYPAHAYWKDALKIAEEYDEKLINVLGEKYIRPHINTYTFTKSLAENLVRDMCKDKIPAIIVRPSVVINAYVEPIPGWNDTVNGPIGLLLATAKGLVRTILVRPNATADFVPVDFVINGMLLAVTESDQKKILRNVEVYNLSLYKEGIITQEELSIYGIDCARKFPFSRIFWYPRVSLTYCFVYYYIQVLCFQVIPAIIFDTIFRIIGQPPIFLKLQRKIYNANISMATLMSTSYHFENDKFKELRKKITNEDRGFYYHTLERKSDQIKCLNQSMAGSATYIFKEKFDLTGKESRKMLKKYWYADMVLRTIILGFLFWFFFIKMNILCRSEDKS